MPSKVKPLPLRLPDPLKARTLASAAARGDNSHHAALLRLIDAGLMAEASRLANQVQEQLGPDGGAVMIAAQEDGSLSATKVDMEAIMDSRPLGNIKPPMQKTRGRTWRIT